MSTAKQVYLVTGAGSGFGALTARALALEGHIVYAGLHSYNGDLGPQEKEAAEYSTQNSCDLRTVPLDLLDQSVIDACVAHILASTGNHLDVVVHNAGHMNYGPCEAFTAEQLLKLYDINTVGMHRLNTAVLPHFRTQRAGHLIYIGSSSTYGAKSPYLGAYFAAKAAMDTLAQVYARELHPWGIETTIIVPGIFGGTNHFTTAMQPGVTKVYEEYEAVGAPTEGMRQLCDDGTASVLPQGEQGNPKIVADKVVEVSRYPRGEKPFRAFVDPVGDGCEAGTTLVDKNANTFFKRTGMEKYLKVWL